MREERVRIARIKSKRTPFYNFQKNYSSFEMIEQYPCSSIPKIEQLFVMLGRKLGIVIMNPKVKRIEADILLINDDLFPEQVGYIRKHNPNLPIVLRYSNPVRNARFKPEEYRKYNVVFSSFQESDCIQYGMYYSPAYITYLLPKDNGHTVEEYDAVYFGRDKGRCGLVKELENVLTNSGYVCYIHLVSDNNQLIHTGNYNKPIPYEKVLEYYYRSKTIIDIQQKHQEGLDIRAIASIVYGKKLIINNPIIKGMDFYNPSNIFVVEDNNLDKLDSFMKEKFVPYPISIVEKYSEDGFINNLIQWSGLRK